MSFPHQAVGTRNWNVLPAGPKESHTENDNTKIKLPAQIGIKIPENDPKFWMRTLIQRGYYLSREVISGSMFAR